MKISKTARTLLAAALTLAPFSAAAAAEPTGEAALPAAFSAQREGLRAAMSAAAAARASAVPAPGDAPSDDWRALIAKARASGEYSPGDAATPATYGIKDLSAPAGVAHVANYVNDWGYEDSNGVFQTAYVTLIEENWMTPADGNWHVDQWLFRLRLNGSIAVRMHKTLVETRDGYVLHDETEALDDHDPRIAAEYDALLARWKAFQPKISTP